MQSKHSDLISNMNASEAARWLFLEIESAIQVYLKNTIFSHTLKLYYLLLSFRKNGEAG